MAMDPPAVDPRAPFEGSFFVPELRITRRWFDARDLTPELRSEVLELLRVAFNDQVSWFALPVAPEDHFDWKFRDRPTGTTIGLTLDPEGRVFGFIGSVRRIWYIHGKPYVNRAGYDLCRAPEWQGRGVQRALNPFRGSEWHPSEAFSMGYVTHPADRHVSIQLGNVAPANETHDYVRHLRARPLRRASALLSRARTRLRQRRRSSEPAPLSNTSRVVRERERTRRDRLVEGGRRARLVVASWLARRPAPRGGDWTISTLTRFEERHRQFISDAMRQFEFVAERSPTYLNWRYCDERAGPFTVRLAQVDGVDVGYAVTRVFAGAAYLADILVLPGQLTVAEALIRDSIELARTGGADFISTRLPKHHPYGPALARVGYFDIGHVGGELLDPRDTPARDLAFFEDPHARIHHVLADSDVV